MQLGSTSAVNRVANGAWVPETEAECTAIREQLERMLSSHLFRNSKRYPNLLRFVVERALEGHTDHLKERTLGIEVFGRAPDYDTNLDPVVRITGVEIRKRIAQYYQEPGHGTEIRIDFPPGTYVPEFRMAPRPVVVPSAPARKNRPVAPIAIAVIALILLAAILVRFSLWAPATALDRFWAPVLDSSEPALLYIGGEPQEDITPPLTVGDLQNAEKVAFSDATTLANVAAFLGSKGKRYHIRQQVVGKLDDLRDGPTVLIGAFNNGWTLKLMGELRFAFERNRNEHAAWVRDLHDPGSRNWSISMSLPYGDVHVDYAIVSRVLDQTTGKVVVTAAGLSKFGTAAAGEFLSNPSYMAEMARSAPKNWDRKNIQIVIASNVVGRSSGPPRILATHFW